MRRSSFLVPALVVCCGAAMAANPQASPSSTAQKWDASLLGAPLLRDPIWVYNDWSAYDELSDNIPLTEELAMRELDQIVRLGKLSVHFNYYMMDAFWFAPDGGYRTWRKPNWPQGPDRWIAVGCGEKTHHRGHRDHGDNLSCPSLRAL